MSLIGCVLSCKDVIEFEAAYFKAFCASSIMSLVDSSPPPLRYQRSGVSWMILPFLAAGVSAIRAFSRTPSLLELSPPMARVRLITKRISGLISLTLSKLTSYPWRESSNFVSVGLNFKVWYKKEKRDWAPKAAIFPSLRRMARAFLSELSFLVATS